MEIERTFVGLDVHARSVVACALDDRTGELSKARLVPENETGVPRVSRTTTTIRS